jgi:hypothetical protein
MDNRDYLALNAELKKELEQSYDANYMVKKEACESYELSQKLFIECLCYVKLHKAHVKMIKGTITHNEKRFLCDKLLENYDSEIQRLTEIITQSKNYTPSEFPF